MKIDVVVFVSVQIDQTIIEFHTYKKKSINNGPPSDIFFPFPFSLFQICAYRAASRVELSASASVESKYAASASEIALLQPIPLLRATIEDEATI
jgi:hypothetical protein